MAIMKRNICKVTSYSKAVGASIILDDYILELMELESLDSKSEQFLALSEAYSKLQDVHILLYEARKKAGYDNEPF